MFVFDDQIAMDDSAPQELYPLIADLLPGDWEDLSAYPQAELLRHNKSPEMFED